MKKIKHSKYKNTGMLFELLTRQITSEIISGRESVATNILKSFFNKNTELFKEYGLYKTLSEERLSSETKSNMLVEAVIKARKKINKTKLSEEKYQLIKSISENFSLDSFFQTKVQNYKLLASIYKIFEYSELDNPSEITRSKFTIIENMTTDYNKPVIKEVNEIYNEPKEIRLLSYKIMVEKFNDKYGELSKEQKAVLREYIGNVSNTNNLKLFIQKEADRIKSVLEQKLNRLSDKTLKIKLTEVISLLDTYKSIKSVDENHISALMRYYDLVNDL
jgi:replicative DNA helicase